MATAAGFSDLVSLVDFGRAGERNHNALCFGMISWKERILNDGRCDSPEGTRAKDDGGIIAFTFGRELAFQHDLRAVTA